MRSPTWLVLTGAAFLAACATAQPMSHSSTASSTAANCDHLIVSPSGLNDQITTLKHSKCKVMWDKTNRPVDIYMVGGKLNPIAADINEAIVDGLILDFAPRLFLMIGRYRDNVSVQDLDFEMLEKQGDDLEAKDLNRTVTAVLPAGSAVGHVFSVRETETDVVLACVVVTTQGSRNAPTRIAVCRSVTKKLSDEEKMTAAIVARAQRIASEDFPSILP
ncbi:hypothetical protein [Dongia sp.]|uniref:hypothetical protein n=1 Tax=Dongia sp. TaxID=1977262 RepID=UPI0035ADC260